MMCGNVFFAQGEFVVDYDLTQGKINKVSPKIDDVTFIFPGFNTYDENASVFYFISASPETALYGISTLDGSVVFRMNVTNLAAIEYSNVQDKLFAIETNSVANQKRLAHIDTKTKTIQYIGDPIPEASMFQGQDSYNDKDTVFTIIAPPNILYSFHTGTGQVLYQPTVKTPSGHNVQCFAYHAKNGTLYALVSNGTSGIYLCRLDIATGELTKVGNKVHPVLSVNSATVDQNQNHIIFLYNDMGKYMVSALSLTTGEMIYNTFIPLQEIDNVIDVEFDNKQNILYSKHWDAEITTKTKDAKVVPINIFPNPSKDYITLGNIPENVTSCTLEIYDEYGRKNGAFERVVSNQKLQIHHLKEGKYFGMVYFDGIHMFTEKFVVVK